MKGQMQWVFGVLPSKVESFLWTVTLEDVRICTEVKIGEMCAVGAELTGTLCAVVDDTLTALFPESNSNRTTIQEGEEGVARTKEEFIKAFNRVVSPQ